MSIFACCKPSSSVVGVPNSKQGHYEELVDVEVRLKNLGTESL